MISVDTEDFDIEHSSLPPSRQINKAKFPTPRGKTKNLGINDTWSGIDMSPNRELFRKIKVILKLLKLL